MTACFRECFVAYDAARELVQEEAYRIANIYWENFSEDDILRYHYLAYHYPEAENVSDYYVIMVIPEQFLLAF